MSLYLNKWWFSGEGTRTTGAGDLDAWIRRTKRTVPGVFLKQASAYAFVFRVPDHGVDLFANLCHAQGVSITWKACDSGSAGYDFEELGREAVRRAHAEGELLRDEGDFHPYQYNGIGLGLVRPHLCWWKPGSGKTRMALGWLLAHPGVPALYVTTVGALETSRREIESLSPLRPFVWMSQSRRRKRYEGLIPYLERCKREGTRPIVMAGYENLADLELPGVDEGGAPGKRTVPGAFSEIDSPEARALGFTKFKLVFDEVHEAKSHKRWEAVIGELGDVQFSRRNSITGCCMALRQKAAACLPMTGTAVPDRPRDMWAPYDLLDPWGFGGFYDYATRYCNGQPGAFGGFDSSGVSHRGELQERLEFCTSWVGRAEVAQYMPDIRRTSYYIRRSELAKPEEGWKSLLKRARGDSEALAEVQSCITASAKRKVAAKFIAERLRAGEKVLVFGGFRVDCERLAEALRKELAGDRVEGEGILVEWTHGAHDAGPTGERQRRVDNFREWPGPACLVGTQESIGQSLNLQFADTLVWVKLPMVPMQLEQGDGRIDRIGREGPGEIIYMVAEGTIDERAAALLLAKLPTVSALAKDPSLAATAKVIKGYDDPKDLLAELVAGLDGVDWTIPEEE